MSSRKTTKAQTLVVRLDFRDGFVGSYRWRSFGRSFVGSERERARVPCACLRMCLCTCLPRTRASVCASARMGVCAGCTSNHSCVPATLTETPTHYTHAHTHTFLVALLLLEAEVSAAFPLFCFCFFFFCGAVRINIRVGSEVDARCFQKRVDNHRPARGSVTNRHRPWWPRSPPCFPCRPKLGGEWSWSRWVEDVASRCLGGLDSLKSNTNRCRGGRPFLVGGFCL